MKVLICDDVKFFADKLVSEFLSTSLYSECYTAYSGNESLNKYHQYKPDHMIMDYEMPDNFGTNIARSILTKDYKIKIILMSGYSDQKVLTEVRSIENLSGFILKNDHNIEDYPSIALRACRIKPYFSPGFIPKLREHYLGKHYLPSRLSNAQQRILSFIGFGLDDEEIADRLGKAVSTVQWHSKQIRRVLGVHSRRELRNVAFETGLCKNRWKEMRLIDKFNPPES